MRFDNDNQVEADMSEVAERAAGVQLLLSEGEVGLLLTATIYAAVQLESAGEDRGPMVAVGRKLSHAMLRRPAPELFPVAADTAIDVGDA